MITRRTLHRCHLLGVGTVLALSAWIQPGWSDCAALEKAAMTRLATAKQAAFNGGSIKHEDFSRQFAADINSMQQAGCISSLMNLLQYVQEEQARIQAGPAAPQAP